MAARNARKRAGKSGTERVLWILILLCAAATLVFFGAAFCRKIETDRAEAYYRSMRAETSIEVSFDGSDDLPHSQTADILSSQRLALFANAPQAAAWIRCEDTPIDYPVGQAADNVYYLRRLLDGTYNRMGTIFIDYRNQADMSDDNTILYGHHFDDVDSMFSTLPRYAEQSYYEAHPRMELISPQTTYQVDLFAGFTAGPNAELPLVFGGDGEARDAFIRQAMENSDFDADISFDGGERFVTLVTCADNGARRYILIGALKEME